MCPVVEQIFKSIKPAQYEKDGLIGEHLNAVVIIFEESEKEVYERITKNDKKSLEIMGKLYEKLNAMVVLVQRYDESVSLYNQFIFCFGNYLESYVEFYSQLKRRLRNDFNFFDNSDDLYCSK